MEPLLQVRDLETRFYTTDGVVHALNGVTFDLAEGETVAIVGESGSGKSVTVMSLLGLIPQPPGRIEGGQALLRSNGGQIELLGLSRQELRSIRGGKIGFIFQDPLSSLNPVMTIGDQIAESLVTHLGMGWGAAQERAIELLDHVGIPDARARYDNYPHHFSGGMRQRVMIAIAIACTPPIVIADEPTTALDVTVQAQIVDLVSRLRDELGVAVIWITHDLGVVAGLADRVLVMYGGMVVEEALVDDLYETPRHPYTIGLLGALPSLDDTSGRRLVSIQGRPPDVRSELTSCPFAPRCVHAADPCRQKKPSPISVGHRHRVACLYDVDEGRFR